MFFCFGDVNVGKVLVIVQLLTIFPNNGCTGCYSGVNETNFKNDCDIFPNPSTGIFTVQSLGFKIQRLEITDVTGREAYKSHITSQKTEIDLSGQPKGIYFVKASDAEGNFAVKKIIVQ